MTKEQNSIKMSFKSSSHSLSPQDKIRRDVANRNHEFVQKYPNLISKQVYLIDNSEHDRIEFELSSKAKPNKEGKIFVNNKSTIWSAIDCHKRNYKNIYLLNFADAEKPGGGYLNGRNAQEECLCRQTLLYPTLFGNEMYEHNIEIGPTSDYMILSKDVLVIRGDDNYMLKRDEQFKVDIISSAAYDNRKPSKDSKKIMEQRISKIIRLAARESSKNSGLSALILGAFGCGVFRNDPNDIASIFADVLNRQGLKKYFDCVIFPIYNGHNSVQLFRSKLT